MIGIGNDAAAFPDGEARIENADGHRALLRLRDMLVPAVLGEAGIRDNKQEGDRATPSGRLVLRRVLFRADRVSAPRCAVPREALAPGDGWCDDPAHPDYNRPVALPHPGRHEALWRDDALYDLIGVLGWNDDPVRRGCGSAIFLHAAPPGGAPTAGCIGIERDALRRLLEGGLRAITVPAPV